MYIIIQCCDQHKIQAVVTFIDYSAAFDTESQLFLDSALAEAGVSTKVRRIVQAIFSAATGVVRIKQQDGEIAFSESFNIERGVLQGDIFSPVYVLHRRARQNFQAARSSEPRHDSGHGCIHRPHVEVRIRRWRRSHRRGREASYGPCHIAGHRLSWGCCDDHLCEEKQGDAHPQDDANECDHRGGRSEAQPGT